MPLAPGDTAPPFSLPSSDGGVLTLESLKGKKVVLYFYPKDDTSGCTKEAMDFNGLKSRFEAAGATIVGVSPDDVKSHNKFKTKHNLDLTLISDENKAMLEAFKAGLSDPLYAEGKNDLSRYHRNFR